MTTEPIPSLTVRLEPSYRVGDGKKFRTRRGAYNNAAWRAWFDKYHPEGRGAPCDCHDDGPDKFYCGDTFYPCKAHDYEAAKPIVQRLARWLAWRDRRSAATWGPLR